MASIRNTAATKYSTLGIVIAASVATVVAVAIPYIPPELFGVSAGLLALRPANDRQDSVSENKANPFEKARDLAGKIVVEWLKDRLEEEKEDYVSDRMSLIEGKELKFCDRLTVALAARGYQKEIVKVAEKRASIAADGAMLQQLEEGSSVPLPVDVTRIEYIEQIRRSLWSYRNVTGQG